MSNYQDEERLKIEKLISEISTRESSTLVFSTVAASVSLALLVGILNADNYTVKPWFWWVGFLFSALGFVYRELTIHVSEIPSYKKLPCYLRKDEASRIIKLGRFIRMMIVRAFLLLPVGAWFLIRSENAWICWLVITVFLIIVFSFGFSMAEEFRRDP